MASLDVWGPPPVAKWTGFSKHFSHGSIIVLSNPWSSRALMEPMSYAAPVSPISSNDIDLNSSTVGCNIPATSSTLDVGSVSTRELTRDAKMGTESFKKTCNAGSAFWVNSTKLFQIAWASAVDGVAAAVAAATAAEAVLPDWFLPFFPFSPFSFPFPLSPLEPLSSFFPWLYSKYAFLADSLPGLPTCWFLHLSPNRQKPAACIEQTACDFSLPFPFGGSSEDAAVAGIRESSIWPVPLPFPFLLSGLGGAGQASTEFGMSFNPLLKLS